MSTRKAQELDVLGETHLPDDLFTNTDGLNWMLDTFPDLGKGMGVLDHETLGDPKSPPTLPDGIVLEASEDLGEDQIEFGGLGDIGEMTREAGLTDLSWLELAEQDPERLPDNPVDNGIPELEQAWGAHRRTDGISLLPNVDRDQAVYESSLVGDQTSEEFSQAIIEESLRSASRKVTSGASFSNVAREVADRLGEHAHLAREGMAKVKDDAGLIGRVFIRAANYPGCASGKWNEPVRKHAAGAAYLVKKKACGGCVHAQSGSCAMFKKQMVASVPWSEAVQRYLPVLEASGRKVASDLAPKEALRKAFREAPVGLQAVGDVRPIQPVAADQVSLEDARKALAATPVQSSILETTRKEALVHVARWKAKGMLTHQDAERLASAQVSGADILRTAARLISVVKVGDYKGGQNAGKMGYEATREEAWKALASAEDRSKQATELIQREMERREKAASREGKRVAAIERKAASIRAAIDRGLQGKALVAAIVRTFDAADRGLAAAILDPYIKSKNALAERTPRAAAAYSGLANDVRTQEVTASEAWAQLRQVHTPSPIDLAERRRLQAHQKLVHTLGRWVRDGILPRQAADRLAQSSAEPREVLRVAAALAGRAKTAAYSGVLNDLRVPEVSASEAWALLKSAEDKNQKATEVVAAEVARRTHAASREGKKEATVRAKVAKVTQAIDRGLRGTVLKNFIRKLLAADEIPLASKLLDPVLSRTGALEEVASGPKEYEGAHYERAATEAPKAAPGPGFREAERLLRWARQQMTEGFAGRDLDNLLEGRFASSVRTAASSAIRTLRAKHEGLSGQVYVDAEAYATKTGSAGCEKGALRHRANQIPTVMQMSRCASCVHRVAKADGTPVCSTYNKRLIASINEAVENPKAYQKEALRLANGTDAENTAAMFNTFDPSEFDLGEEGELDDLVLDDAPSDEEVADVFFGGMELE